MRSVTVIGAGTMGHGIAHVCALAGYDVTLVDTARELVERGLEKIRSNLDEGVRRGKVTGENRDAALGRLKAATDIAAAVREADLVIEAVPEKLDLKIQIFRAIDASASPDSLLATNTSSLSISEIQRATARPERVLGLHFFNPVHINQLLEVVYGEDTAPARIEQATAFGRAIGKEPIVVRDSPGFASSRLGVLLGLEAMRMVEEGVASAQDIDKAMELGYRHPMGPLKLTDLVGLDVRLDIARYLHGKLRSKAFRPPKILERMVAEGKLGKKSGEGFYRWNESP